MLRQIGAATTTANKKSTGQKWGCVVQNAPRGSWFHRHNAKNDKLESTIAQGNACGLPKLVIRHARHAERLRPGTGHDAVAVDLDAVEP
jgi:hypothetical protein